jgi:hypothetical protein
MQGMQGKLHLKKAEMLIISKKSIKRGDIMRKVQYKTNVEREKLIKEAAERNEVLIEDAVLTDEKYLIFDFKESLTEKEIDLMVVEKIRQRYDINEEFKMINYGIIDPDNSEYREYRKYVEECRAWGREQKQKYGLLEVL